MEKKNPSAGDHLSRTERIRDAAQILKTWPLERPVSQAQWDQLTDELTSTDLERLKAMAEGHRNRIEMAIAESDASLAVDEATNAVLLWPRDSLWASNISALLEELRGSADVSAFRSALRQRTGRSRQNPKRTWVFPTVIGGLALITGLSLTLLFLFGRGSDGINAPLQGPRTLGAAFDTQGVKTNIAVSQSRLLLFPEATVAEISAWVVFPDDKVGLWQGKVSVLDAAGKPLAERDVTFHKGDAPPLEPGQGMAVFQQFDAWPWFDKVASFQLTTTRILAQSAHPADKTTVAFTIDPPFPTGYKLRIWSLDQGWGDRFVSKVHKWSLEFENAGYQPFKELTLKLIWTSWDAKVIKTETLRPVTSFRSPLAPGNNVSWHQNSIFETEVYRWTDGREPLPRLEVVSWH